MVRRALGLSPETANPMTSPTSRMADVGREIGIILSLVALVGVGVTLGSAMSRVSALELSVHTVQVSS